MTSSAISPRPCCEPAAICYPRSSAPMPRPSPPRTGRFSLCGLSPARRAEQTGDQADRNHDYGAEQEVAPQSVDGIEAQIIDPVEQPPDAADDIPGIQTDRGEHHPDQGRQQD